MGVTSQTYIILLAFIVLGFIGLFSAIAQGEHTVAIWLLEEGKAEALHA